MISLYLACSWSYQPTFVSMKVCTLEGYQHWINVSQPINPINSICVSPKKSFSTNTCVSPINTMLVTMVMELIKYSSSLHFVGCSFLVMGELSTYITYIYYIMYIYIYLYTYIHSQILNHLPRSAEGGIKMP